MATATVVGASAEPRRSASQYFIAGHRIARQSVGLPGVEQLYERYAAEWPRSEKLKGYVLAALRERATLFTAIDELMGAVTLDPNRIGWQRCLALVLEQAGRLDRALLVRQLIERLWPGTIENQAAILRLRERAGMKDGDGPQIGPASVEDSALLDLCRRLAVGPSESRGRQGLREIQLIVRERLVRRPNDVRLHLACGFLGLSRSDMEAARESFVTASLLARRDTGPPDSWAREYDYDPWALTYGEAFLLDQLADGRQLNLLTDLDRVRLSLVQGAVLRSKHAILPALQVYGDGAMRLLPASTPSSYRIYRGHTIVLHHGRFYAVPRKVRSFSILDGVVVRGRQVDPYGVPKPALWRRQVHRYLSAARRARVRSLARRSFATAQRTAHRIPLLLRAWRLVLTLLRPLNRLSRIVLKAAYKRFFAVPGVLTDMDVVPLQQRIDRIASQPVDRHG